MKAEFYRDFDSNYVLKKGWTNLFANIYLEIESIITKEINSMNTRLEKDYYSLHSIDISLIDGEVEISGFDKLKGEEFTIFYDYHLKTGRVHYLDGIIERFKD